MQIWQYVFLAYIFQSPPISLTLTAPKHVKKNFFHEEMNTLRGNETLEGKLNFFDIFTGDDEDSLLKKVCFHSFYLLPLDQMYISSKYLDCI